MNTQLLPLGSVVSLTGAVKKLMIVGIIVKNTDTDKMYDYIGLSFPEGYIDSEAVFLFMHKDIEDIHFIGYVNAETQAFRAHLAKELEDKGEIVRVE